MFGQSPAAKLKIADDTVACAIEIAAAMVLAEHDRDIARLTSMETAAAMWGVKQKEPQITWETEREL